MAAYSHSRTLFIQENGRPIVFSIMPCEEKKRLRPLVEHGGGILTSACREGSIRLAVPGTVSTEKDAISSDYVWDCVDQNRLLKMRDYRVWPGMQPARVSANDSDSELRPSTTIIPKKRLGIRGRQKYSLSEDMRIFSYIISEKVHNDVRGKLIWKQMQKIKLTDHTAESMRSHFLKSMIPRLDSYPIRDAWKQKLAYLPPENKNLPLPVYDTRPGSTYSSSDVDIDENEEAEVESRKSSQRNSQERRSPGERHGNGQSRSPQKHSTRPHSRADKVVNEGDVNFLNESDSDHDEKGGSDSSHETQHKNHDEESYSGDSEDGNTNNNGNANSKRRRISSSDDEIVRVRKERRDGRQRRSNDSNYQQQRRPVTRNGLDEPQPGPSNKRTSSSSAHRHAGSPSKMRRTRQHQEADNAPDFPVPRPSTSRQNTGPGNKNARTATPRGRSSSNMESVVEVMCRDFDLSAKQAVQCLWVCSGSVEDAFHWLQHGKRHNGLEAWSKEEDQILRSADPIKTKLLDEKFGEEDVSKRLVFLGI